MELIHNIIKKLPCAQEEHYISDIVLRKDQTTICLVARLGYFNFIGEKKKKTVFFFKFKLEKHELRPQKVSTNA